MDNIQIVKHALSDLLTSDLDINELIVKYFSTDYQQTVDGKTLGFNEFVAHMQLLRSVVKQFAVTIDAISQSGDQVHTHHFVKVTKTDNSVSEFEVFALFKIANHKIVTCNELTRQLHGNSEDKDLGARH